MQTVEVTFFDAKGIERIGELVNASRIRVNGRVAEAAIDRRREEVIIVTDRGGELLAHSVLMGNVRCIQPVVFS